MVLWAGLMLCHLALAGPALAGARHAAFAAGQSGQQALQSGQQAAPTEAAFVLFRLPHDPEAFTQGLVFHEGVFFESTGLYGQSSLRRVEPSTGRVLARRALPAQLFGEGLALAPGENGAKRARLVQLTWKEGLILTWDAATLRPLSRRPLRGQGWGLAFNGRELALSDGTDTLRFLDARTLAETGRTLPVRDGGRPVERLNELEWVNGWLLANVWGEDRIAVIRPGPGQGVGQGAGQVVLWIDLSPLRRELAGQAEAANGIAFDPAAGNGDGGNGAGAGDGGRGLLYVTGKLWDKIFALRLPELLRRPPSPPVP
jgi:glutamine cyclotransferase